MDNEKLEKRLRATPLSTPGITLEEVTSRARPPRRWVWFSTPRLAAVAAGVWLVAWLVTIPLDRGIPGPTPYAATTSFTAGAAPDADVGEHPWSYANARALLDDPWLVLDEPEAAADVEREPQEPRRQSSTGRDLVGRLSHV